MIPFSFDVLLLTLPLAVYTNQWWISIPAIWWLFDVMYEAAWLRGLHEPKGKKYIYFFADKGQLLPTVKIGRATDVKSRLAAHNTAAPFTIKVYLILRVTNSVAAEKHIHNRYTPLRIRKRNEWFYLPLWLWCALTINKMTKRFWYGKEEAKCKKS